MITRRGGWQVITGTKTVIEIYARKIVDSLLDPYSLINGHEGSDAHWNRKRQKYLGVPVFPRKPRKPVVDVGHTRSKCAYMLGEVNNGRNINDSLTKFVTGSCALPTVMRLSCRSEDLYKGVGLSIFT